jgi:hypothetical protein
VRKSAALTFGRNENPRGPNGSVGHGAGSNMLRIFEHSMPLPVVPSALYEIFLGSAAPRLAIAPVIAALADLRCKPRLDTRRPGPKGLSGFFTIQSTSLQFRGMAERSYESLSLYATNEIGVNYG